MAYWIYKDGERIGPLRVIDVVSRAGPGTLVSAGSDWVRFCDHPDFAAPEDLHPGSSTRPKAQESIRQLSPVEVKETHQQRPQMIPFEDPEVGVIRGFLPTLRMFVFKPRTGFERIQHDQSVFWPLLYSITIIVLILIAVWLATTLAWSIFNSRLWSGITGGDPFAQLFAQYVLDAFENDPDYGSQFGIYRGIPGYVVATAVFAAVVYMLLNLVRALLTHFFLVRFRAKQPSVPATVRVALYSTTPNILILLFLLTVVFELLRWTIFGSTGQTIVRPLIVFALIACWFVWTFLLEIIGFKYAYALGGTKAGLAVGIPHVAFLGAVGAVVIFSAAVVVGLFSSLSQDPRNSQKPFVASASDARPQDSLARISQGTAIREMQLTTRDGVPLPPSAIQLETANGAEIFVLEIGFEEATDYMTSAMKARGMLLNPSKSRELADGIQLWFESSTGDRWQMIIIGFAAPVKLYVMGEGRVDVTDSGIGEDENGRTRSNSSRMEEDADTIFPQHSPEVSAAGLSVNTPSDRPTATYTTDVKGNLYFAGGSSAAEQAPAWVPVYPDGQFHNPSFMGMGKAVVGGFEIDTTDHILRVFEYYRAALDEGGFTVTLGPTNEGSGVIRSLTGEQTSTGRKVEVKLRWLGGTTNTSVSYSQGK